MSEQQQRTVLVLGARNLGGAIARRFLADGWRVAAVARSEETLASVRADGILAIEADATDRDSLRAAMDSVRAEHGSLDCVVNAVSAARPPDDGTPFGGGPVTEATIEGFEGWTAAVARQCFAFLSAGAEAIDPGGTLIQVAGGSSRRATAGKGLWAAGSAALRALTHAAALELRERDQHAALLIVDGIIASPKTAEMTAGNPARELVDQDQIAAAALYLAGQGAQAMTHELQVTPAGDRWLP